MSQPTLYYSNRCAHSRTVLQTLDQMNKTALVNTVCVDTVPRHQLPPFLKSVPTLYVPDTKDVYIGQQIYAYIAKPVTSRKEIPTTAPPVASQGAPQQRAPGGGDPEAWNVNPTGLTETYSMWDSPSQFADTSQYRFTFLEGAGPGGMLPQNLQQRGESDTGDIQKRLAAMQQQRDKEFTAVARQ